MSVEKIQSIRRELAALVEHQVKPLKQQLEDLLIAEATRLCPFSIGDIITLDNGKLGQITTIKYLSLDYGFSENEDTYNFLPKVECDIDYKFAYKVDDAKFSITWNISGFRMIKNNTKVGLTSFVDINPVFYLIDKEAKSVKKKILEDYGIEDLLGLDKL